MNKLTSAIKNHQQKLVLVVGFLLVALIGFELGKKSVSKTVISEIQEAQALDQPANYTPKESTTQTNCQGQIKGSASMIYHIPGGAFYDKTTKPIRCFDTETDAQSAGFRKSSR